MATARDRGGSLSLSLSLSLSAQQPRTLHASALRLKAAYEARGWSGYVQELHELHPEVNDHNMARLLGAPDRPESWLRSGAPRRAPDQRFWERMSALYSGEGAGGGGVGSSVVGPPLDFRGSFLFVAPYAAEFLQSWTPSAGLSGGPVNGYGQYYTPPSSGDAVRLIDMQASFCARQGVNVIRTLFPMGAWLWWQQHAGGTGNWQAFVKNVMRSFNRHGIRVIIALGNTFGADPLRAIPPPPVPAEPRLWSQDAAFVPAGKEYLIYDELAWAAGFYQEPSMAMVMEQNAPFLAKYYSYVDELVTTLNDPTDSAVQPLAWELFNEPDGVAWDKIAPVVRDINGIVVTKDPGRPRLLGARSPVTMESLNVHLGAEDPEGADWLGANLDWMGIHIQTVPLAYSGRYLLAGKVGIPGFPSKALRTEHGLRGSPPNYPVAITGAIAEAQVFLALHGLDGFFEESCARSAHPQMLHDLDLACRDNSTSPFGDRLLGLGYSTTAYSTFAPWPLSMNGGDPFIAREGMAMRDRLQMGDPTWSDAQVDAVFRSIDTGAATGRVFNLPALTAGSLAMQPLVLQSGNGTATTTLVVASDLCDNLPTTSHYESYAFLGSGWSGRNKIWFLAFRSPTQAGAGVNSQVQDLSPVNALLSLSHDLRFKEVDDNLPIGPNDSALRTRGSFWSVDDLTNWCRPELTTGQPNFTPTHYPTGFVGIDPVWLGVPGNPAGAKVPTLPFPSATACAWPDYHVDGTELRSVELELVLRRHLIPRQRQAYTGVTGKIAGVGLPATGANTVGRFLLAYHRVVPRNLNAQEHYGPGQDGPGDWSSRYGDLYRKQGTNPEKYEIVLLDLTVQENSPGVLSFVPAAQVLETRGNDWGPGTPHANETGASAMDPMLATNANGDAALVYRKVEDPYYRFNPVFQTAQQGSPVPGTLIHEFDPSLSKGDCSSGDIDRVMLPIQATQVPAAQPVRWRDTAVASLWDQYPSVLCVRYRAAGAASFGPEQVVSESFETTSGPVFPLEVWSSWRQATVNLREYGGASYLALSPTDSRFGRWLADRVACGTSLPCPLVDEGDPHSWIPAVPASLQLGEPVNEGEGDVPNIYTPIVVGWKQMPRERRQDFTRSHARLVPEMPAYGVYALRLRGQPNSTLVVPTTDYSRFKSTAVLVGLTPGGSSRHYDPTFTTWGTPAVHFDHSGTPATVQEQDTGNLFAQWQQRWFMHRENEQSVTGVPAAFDNPFPGQPGLPAILHQPVSGYEPRRGLFANDSTLRLTAWVRQRYVGNQLGYRVAYDWEVKSQPDSSGIREVPTETGTGVPLGTFETTQADVRVVAVVPFARTGPNGKPRGRIVFVADDDLWLVEVPYEKDANQAPLPATVRRITPVSQRANGSPTGKGIYPSLKLDVSATRDVVAWTCAGKIHAVRWTP